MLEQNLNKKIKIGFALNTGFAIFEILMGLASGSLALISDAVHNLTDSLTMLIAFIGQRFAGKKPTKEHTFGYGKAAILTALINSVILIAIAVYIFYEAYQRILHPESVKGGIVMAVAAVGILINGGVAIMFLNNRDNLNAKGIFLNMAFDAIASTGALLAGLIILLTGKTIVDPIIGIGVGIMLVYGAGKIIYDVAHILLEGVPENINTEEVEKAISAMAGVKKVCDLHIWTIASQKAALSCQIIFTESDLIKDAATIKQIKGMLNKNFSISHATIEAAIAEEPPHEH